MFLSEVQVGDVADGLEGRGDDHALWEKPLQDLRRGRDVMMTG